MTQSFRKWVRLGKPRRCVPQYFAAFFKVRPAHTTFTAPTSLRPGSVWFMCPSELKLIFKKSRCGWMRKGSLKSVVHYCQKNLTSTLRNSSLSLLPVAFMSYFSDRYWREIYTKYVVIHQLIIRALMSVEGQWRNKKSGGWAKYQYDIFMYCQNGPLQYVLLDKWRGHVSNPPWSVAPFRSFLLWSQPTFITCNIFITRNKRQSGWGILSFTW